MSNPDVSNGRATGIRRVSKVGATGVSAEIGTTTIADTAVTGMIGTTTIVVTGVTGGTTKISSRSFATEIMTGIRTTDSIEAPRFMREMRHGKQAGMIDTDLIGMTGMTGTTIVMTTDTIGTTAAALFVR